MQNNYFIFMSAGCLGASFIWTWQHNLISAILGILFTIFFARNIKFK